ncbi:MAG: lysophospholipid acyltransferase family protein [Pseudomonadales bacterium]
MRRLLGDYPVDPLFENYLRDQPVVSYVEPTDPPLKRFVARQLEKLCGREMLEALYREIKAEGAPAQAFFGAALARAGIELEIRGTQPEDLGIDTPLVFIANHPYGIVDGLALCELGRRVRGEFRIMLNALLYQDRELAPLLLPVDFAPTAQAKRANIRSKQLAEEALAAGIPLLIFPAGGVSTRSRFGFGPLADLPWTTFAAKLILRTRATVVPCFFHGENDRLFHIASHIAAPLRLAMLLRAVQGHQQRPLRVTIGEPIRFESLPLEGGRAGLTAYLHACTWALGGSSAN